MEANALVFRCDNIPVESIIEHVIKNGPRMEAGEARVIRAAQAIEGEVWSPQLPAFDAWVSRGGPAAAVAKEALGGAAAGERGVVDGAGLPFGTDGDLLVVGSLGMGITDEAREKLIRQAVRKRGDGSDHVAPPACGAVDLRDAVGVRQDPDGYALTLFDLRLLSRASGSADGMVVALPAFVDGIPVVRIAAEAFARRLVQGVGVRLLVVPDTVTSIAEDAFSLLSAQRIHLGCNVLTLGKQPCDVAGVAPRLARRAFSVEPGNGRYEAREGSLFDDGGRRLLFLASPYGERVDLPAGVECVTDSAFALGCEPPSVVSGPSSLARVDAKAWDDAVWRCSDGTAARRPLAARGVRLAGAAAVEQDGCWYDFDDEGAVLVAGPPAPASVSRRFAQEAALRAAALQGLESASAPGWEHAAAPAQVLALPHEVEGRPLVRIGVRALPYAPSTLVVPACVRAIERDNFCRGTKRLVLSEGLQRIGAHCFCSRMLEPPVSVPASVRAVGEGSFEYAVCRLERTGSIVHVSADQLLSCFRDEAAEDGVPFDFSCYDELLCSAKNLPDKLGAVLHRLAVPYRLSSRAREALVAYLRSHEREAQERIARDGDRAMVAALSEAGFIDERTFDRQIELLRACNRADCVIYLMDWRQKRRAAGAAGHVGAPAARDRFAL